MIRQSLLLSTGVSAILMGMAAAPAAAQSVADDESVIDSEAQGTFDGFESTSTIVIRAVEKTNLDFNVTDIQPSERLIVRDDVGVGFGDPTNSQPSVVHLFQQVNATGGVFFNCTGTVINPRTVLTAAHCLNASSAGLATRSSEAYGSQDSGAERTVLVATGQSSAGRLFDYLDFGSSYSEGGLASSTDVIIHPTGNLDNEGLGFAWADVALIALDEPITDVPYLPLLLTPLSELTHVLQVGYGTNGVGSGTGPTGSSFLRRVGENMLGLVGSTGDFVGGVFPAFAPASQTLGFESQAFYWTDFDNPDRTAEEQAGCDFPGFTISCDSLASVLAIDYFDGDALPLEAGTAPGDSGSPLIVDELYDQQVVTAVLSGGFDFFGLGNVYSDVSFYTPLYPFFEFLSENTPYKYVSAIEGDGNWSDSSHWTQDLDPGFLIDDGTGTLVNGIPGGNEPGIFEAGPKLGSVLGTDISGNTTAITPGFEGIDTSIPESSVLLGAGSTGFVPNNTDGTPGIAFDDPAQYFDVLLTAAGTTTVDIDVEIDRLTVDGNDTRFVLTPNKTFTSIIGVEQYRGETVINGQLNAGNLILFGGQLGGRGTIDTGIFFNVAGGLFVGGQNKVDTLTVNGDFVNTSGGFVVVDVNRKSADVLEINGDAVISGTLAVLPNGSFKNSFGSQYTVLTADTIDGSFDDVATLSNSPVLYFDQVVNADSIAIEVKARSIAGIVGQDSMLSSLGSTLDGLRSSGRYAQFSDLFSVVDGAGFDTFGATLLGLTPISGFAQTETSNSFARRFTGQIAQRTLTLRGASEAAAGFSSSGSASFAQAGAAPTTDKKLGFFGSVSGSFLDDAETRNSGVSAIEQAAFSDAGEITLGADYKLSDTLSIGMAVSNVRDSASNIAASQPTSNESVSTAIYAAFGTGSSFADVYVGYSDQRFGLERGAQGLLEEQFRSAFGVADGTQTMAGVRAGYAFEPATGMTVGPVASLDYMRSDLEGYSEAGAGSFGLQIRDRAYTSVGAKMGLMGELNVNLGQKNKLSAFGSVAYARELGDTQDIVTASFAGAADLPFSITRELAQDWVAVNAGANLALSDRFSTQLSVTSDMGRQELSNHQGRVSLNWKF